MSRSKIVVIVAALVVVAGAIVAIGVALSGDSESDGDSSAQVERVRLEIRGKPQARIKVDGKLIGKTPLSIYVKKSSTPMVIEAFTDEHIMPLGKRPITRPREMSRKIVPDRDLVIDFVPPPMPITPDP